MEIILLEQLDKVLERFFASACKENLSPMILKGNQNSDNLIDNYQNFDKTRVKLFPNFTRHYLITHIIYILTLH